MSRPASAQATALILAVAMHFRTRGFDFAESVEQAERLLDPFWKRSVGGSDGDPNDEVWAALFAAFDDSERG